MFEVAELGRKVSKQEFDESRTGAAVGTAGGGVCPQKPQISRHYHSFSGANCAGKGEFVHRLNEWLDPRGVDTHAFAQSTEEERRPAALLGGFGACCPRADGSGFFFWSWYSEPMVRRVLSGD